MRLFCLVPVAILLTSFAASAAEDPYAEQLFKQHCASCHEAGAAAPGARIPPVSVLKTMTPTAILRALETGIMKSQAAVLSTLDGLTDGTVPGTVHYQVRATHQHLVRSGS